MSVSFVQCQFFSAAGVTIRLETQVQTTNGKMARVLLRKRGIHIPLFNR